MWTVVVGMALGAPQLVPSADLDANEQLLLERLQAVRASPRGALTGLRAQLELEEHAFREACQETGEVLAGVRGMPGRPPLAPSQSLVDAARAHARDMIARDYFEHVNPDGIGPNARLARAGYPLPVGRPVAQVKRDIWTGYSDGLVSNQVEAIHQVESFSNGDAPVLGAADWSRVVDSLIVDRCVPDRGHRRHLLGEAPLDAAALEVGIGGAARSGRHPEDRAFSGFVFRVAIETATRADATRYVVGVVYRDLDGNGAYGVGEGVAGVEVRAEGSDVFTRTAPGGGYVLPVPRLWMGAITVAGTTRTVNMEGTNQKVDVVLP